MGLLAEEYPEEAFALLTNVLESKSL
jgi:hypothetical protein